MLRPYKGTLRDDPPLVARVLLVRSHPQRRGLARRVRLRPAVPRPLPLDPAARGKSAAAGAWLDHVALSGVAAARRRGSADHPRRGRDAVAHGAAARGQARLARALRKGRGSEPHRLVQGPRARGRCDPRRARRGQAPGGATAGNAGVALAAYAARAGLPARVYAPATTPPTILGQIRSFDGDLVLVDGHIGDCGKAARAYAAETGAVDVSTLREPYRIEGKKTLGLEL